MKSKFHYKLTVNEKNIFGEKIITYGIIGKNISFDDVSTDRQKVSEMVDRLNREQLEESQFMYFIEDELV